MPEVGAVTQVDFSGDHADDLRRAAHYNAATQTAVVTSGLRKGDEYDLQVVVPDDYSDEALADAAFAPVRMPAQHGVPQDFVDVASKAVGDAATPIEQVRALQTWLSDNGFFSHGLEGEPLSRAGHGAERISTMLGAQQMVGDDEQYAVAMSLLANELGIPARVVMGFHPDEDAAKSPVFTATGNTLHAWVEVAFEGVGWVPFDPTPPKDQVPSDQTTKPRADPKPQVLQPPPPQQEPVDLPPTVADERKNDDDKNAVAGILGLIFARRGRNHRRASAARRAAGRDRRTEGFASATQDSGGARRRPDQRRLERDRRQRRRLRHPGAAGSHPARGRRRGDGRLRAARRCSLSLGARMPRCSAPLSPATRRSTEFWRQVDEIVAGMAQSTSFWGRLRARLNLRSLLVGTRLALPVRSRADEPSPNQENP